MKNLISLISIVLVLSASCQNKEKNQHEEARKPNIIVILADDMGFSDIGSFGSEIRTPNLDELAENGMRMTQFYSAARCCPSRASLLTGLHPHQAGMGLMADQEITLPSYQGYIGENCVTIAQVLNQVGYDTYISGKWHVGDEEKNWPRQHGFDRCFSFIHGASSYFSNRSYRNSEWPWSSGELFTVLDDDIYEYPDSNVYATDLYTDYALEFMNSSLEEDNPFFLYLAYTAPHWPLHALPEDIAKYEGFYDIGWDSLRTLRYARQQELGLFDKEYALSEVNPDVPDWDELSDQEQKEYSKKMAVYAAMIDRMDQNIGRVISKLEEEGDIENTFIMFMSDNGACRSGYIPYLHEDFSRSAPIGTPRSFTAYGPGWANASNTPFRMFKADVHEGGIASPFIAYYPEMIGENQINHSPGHIIDVLPTCADLAGATYPEVFGGNEIQPLAGKSLVPVFKGETVGRENDICFEHSGNKAIIRDSLKMVIKRKKTDWELFNLKTDRTETNNLIKEVEPEVLNSLFEGYYEWAVEVGAYPKDVVGNRTIIKKHN